MIRRLVPALVFAMFVNDVPLPPGVTPTREGRTLGRIREIVRTPANDVWVAEGAGGQVLIPALKDVVESVDVVSRRVVVREVPGLTTT